MKILLVEDTEGLRALFARILRQRGHEVCEAEDGVDALECLDTFHPDLIVTDLMMPRLDGLGLIRHLQTLPALAGVPIVAMTAMDSPEIEGEARDAGASCFLAKPIGLGTFVDCLAQCGPGPTA